MAGHSKWANIKHRKGRQDAQRGKLFTRIGKELTIASKLGGSDISFNPRLRLAVEKAKAANMPKDNMERAIKKGTGELEGVDYQEIRYEGYGPGGVAFLVDVVTDNKNRSASTVRMNFSRNDGNLGETGSVSFLFDRKGVFEFKKESVSEDALMDIALESGAEDVVEKGDSLLVMTTPNDFDAIKEVLDTNNLKYENGEITMYPATEIEITDIDTAKKLMKLYDDLEENEDVQEIYSNFDISDEVMNSIDN